MSQEEFEQLNLPPLTDLVQRQFSKFHGDQNFMFGVAVSARLEHYRRVCCMSYPRAQFAAIAMTLKQSGFGVVR